MAAHANSTTTPERRLLRGVEALGAVYSDRELLALLSMQKAVTLPRSGLRLVYARPGCFLFGGGRDNA